MFYFACASISFFLHFFGIVFNILFWTTAGAHHAEDGHEKFDKRTEGLPIQQILCTLGKMVKCLLLEVGPNNIFFVKTEF